MQALQQDVAILACKPFSSLRIFPPLGKSTTMVVTARMKGSRYLDSVVAKGENRQLILRLHNDHATNIKVIT